MLQDNLKKIRVTLGYSQQDMASKLNINVNTYRGYEYNKREMSYELLFLLVDIFKVNLNWLLSGKGSMFLNSDECTLKYQNDISIPQKVRNFNERLSVIQQCNQFPDKDMAKILGIYEEEYIELKQAAREPSFKIINRLKQFFNISADWLLYAE